MTNYKKAKELYHKKSTDCNPKTMNTYIKYVPNVFLAKCEEMHKRGEIITVTTQRGKENESIVFNLIFEKDGYFHYSIVRADGFNTQEWVKRRAKKLNDYATNTEIKSNQYYRASQEHKDFLSLGEPIKIGHHSAKKHQKLIEQSCNNLNKSVEFSKKTEDYKNRASYWESKANTINLSMPESLDFYEFKLEEAKEHHAGLKSGKYKRDHAYSLTYAKKAVNELEKKLNLAKKLWG